MRTKHLKAQAAWLWLPLFVGTCIVLGFYRSYVAPSGASGQATYCPDSSRLEQFLHCG